MKCFHEPFGDVFYHGAERLSDRYEGDELTRTESGFGNTTYKAIFDEIEKGGSEVGLFPSSRLAYPYPRMYSYVSNSPSFVSQTVVSNTFSLHCNQDFICHHSLRFAPFVL